MKPLIYIAGPYTKPDPVVNVRRAIIIAEEVEYYGGTPFIPHLSMLWHLARPADIATWYQRDLDVLDHCQGLVRFPGSSTGAELECAHAAMEGIPIYVILEDHHNVAALELWIAGLQMETSA